MEAAVLPPQATAEEVQAVPVQEEEEEKEAETQAKDEVFFMSEEEEDAMEITEERAQTPLRQDVGEAVGPDGKIDWDCPCLAGMAEGPCADKFKEAFSCFVYSTEEPKGADCIQHFEAMHDCLVAHPDYYGTVEDTDGGEEAEETASPAPAATAEEEEAAIVMIEEAAASSSESESESESEPESESEAEQSDA